MNAKAEAAARPRDVLQLCGIYPQAQHRLEGLAKVHRLDTASDRAALIESLKDRCEVLVTSGGLGASAATLASLPRLRLVACFGVGVDAIDVDYCTANGITVTNTPDVLTEDVADLAVALMLAAQRRVAQGDRYVRAGRWPSDGFPLGRSVRGSKVGIVGMGRIGQAIARRCEVFGCELAYTGPRRKPVDWRYEADAVALARWADVLIAALPGGASTQGAVSDGVLDALGADGCFVNIARGSVVDQKALVERLVDGRLGSAGLDVFNDEPNVPRELMNLDNVVLLPHIGSATADTRLAMGNLVVDNIQAWLDGRPLPTPFNQPA